LLFTLVAFDVAVAVAALAVDLLEDIVQHGVEVNLQNEQFLMHKPR
jgi:hypothetical protein